MGSGIVHVCAMAGFGVCSAFDGIVKNDDVFASNTIVYPVYGIRNADVVRSLSRPPSADGFGMTRF